MRGGFAFAVLSLAFHAVFAAEDLPVPWPYVEPGECWSFRGSRIENRGPIDDYEECVTFVDPHKGVIIAVAKVKSEGREIDTSYSTEWNERTLIDGTIRTYRQDQRWFRFPLRVGDAYPAEYEFRRATLGSNVGNTTLRVKVVGWEDISVPAGKFRALKIEGDGTGRRYDTGENFPVRIAAWYVPQVNRFVKSWYENPLGRRGVELTGYRLNK